MTYKLFYTICFVLIVIIICLSLSYLIILKHKISKEKRCACIYKYMSELQFQYEKAMKNNIFIKFPMIKTEIEHTLSIYRNSSMVGNNSFDKTKVIRKKFRTEEVLNNKLFHEIKIITSYDSELKAILDLNSEIKKQFALLKMPIQYRIDEILHQVKLHILEILILILKKLDNNTEMETKQQQYDDFDEFDKYKIAHA